MRQQPRQRLSSHGPRVVPMSCCRRLSIRPHSRRLSHPSGRILSVRLVACFSSFILTRLCSPSGGMIQPPRCQKWPRRSRTFGTVAPKPSRLSGRRAGFFSFDTDARHYVHDHQTMITVPASWRGHARQTWQLPAAMLRNQRREPEERPSATPSQQTVILHIVGCTWIRVASEGTSTGRA